MTQLKRFVAVAAAVAAIATSVMFTSGTGPAAADGTNAQGGKFTPLSSLMRRCDFTSAPYLPSGTRGTGFATITRAGNTVSAEVHMVTVAPDIWYGVRLVQMPRPGIGCGPNDPGVAVGRLYTDANGTGTVTVQGPVMEGATGAWVSVEGPLDRSSNQFAGDFRTSDYVAKI